MVDLKQNVIPNTKPALDFKPFQHQYCKKTTFLLQKFTIVKYGVFCRENLQTRALR